MPLTQTQRHLFAVLIIAFSSCFHKSDKTGTADEVKHSLVCNTGKASYLLTHEEIFHATSKSSGSKGSFTSGYVRYRYTIRDLQTGEQVTRLVTGDRDEDVAPIYFDGKHLWCYSADKSLGLHARDAATMEVVITRSQVEQANPSIAGKLNTPKVYEAPQFYSFDPASKQITLTDLEGHLFSMDPSTLRAVAIDKKPSFSSFFNHASSTSAYRWMDERINLSGDPRKQIEIDDLKSSESFLKGEILLEQDEKRLASFSEKMQGANSNTVRDMQRQCDSFLQVYPVLKDRLQAYLTIRNAGILNNYYDMSRNLERLKQDSSNEADKITRHLDDMVLGCDSSSLYIIHAANLTDTSSLLFSKINISGREFKKQWTTAVPGIYFDPSKGIKVNSMANVFKAGNPRFDYEWYGVDGNVLTGVKMLFAFAIDVTDGRLMWKQQL